MVFDICPRVKGYEVKSGAFSADALRVFSLGKSELFFSTCAILLPDMPVERANYAEANIRISVSADYSSQNEFCSLRIRQELVEIHCRDEAGARNAAAILAQILRKTEGGYTLPCGDIRDWPDAQYRAFMVESSGRVWMPMERIMGYIKEMALCRMNVLQFHFMEDPGCTVPLKSVPGFRGGPNGEKFTRQEVDAMIAYAAKLGIRVVPFIEVLSHAADLALQEGLVCPGDDLVNLYDVCLGQEKTFTVIEKVIAEVAEIFPDEAKAAGAAKAITLRIPLPNRSLENPIRCSSAIPTTAGDM